MKTVHEVALPTRVTRLVDDVTGVVRAERRWDPDRKCHQWHSLDGSEFVAFAVTTYSPTQDGRLKLTRSHGFVVLSLEEYHIRLGDLGGPEVD